MWILTSNYRITELNSVIIDEELEGNGLLETRNFLKQNAPSILRNPFEALRKLGSEDENLDRPEREPVLESFLKKTRFRWKNSNLGMAGISMRLEKEETSPEERENQISKRKDSQSTI
ncbi:hypothetical protein E5676_scaffold134G00020 [Cucumis melo var. makuwa]|uniref:Uncharacterized protein n=1 Tax=Cucumis melo var. makuwa TaxID=1194695 RepID=A0A5A7VEF0_CUCMM|nr:hypothetical protein E6C27_scaffold255G004250 [Cucumis melo var. makuwa]TYK19893.1 hypothetical protein E5676_scaffold134G00020 [Cucumis melo var. makuwa]